ncbi:MAG: hypothetical protein PVJ76_21160, partial [Gemmatimonadota bacterium]
MKNSALLQEEGRMVLTRVYSALRALRLYPLENTAVQQSLDELHELLSRLAGEEGALELRVVGDFFFFNEVRLRLDLSNYSTFGSFAQTVMEQGIGAIEVLSGIDRAELAPFLSLLLREPGEPDPFSTFQERMSGAPILHIRVIPASEVKEPELEEDALDAAKRTYAQSVNVAKEALTDFRMGKAVNVRKVKRAVQG